MRAERGGDFVVFIRNGFAFGRNVFTKRSLTLNQQRDKALVELAELLKAAEIKLDADAIEQIDAASKPR